jgi:small subunit ribosomal protein S20
MANIKSAAKQARAGARRRKVNQSIQTLVKSSVRKIRTLASAGKKDEALKLYPAFQSNVDRAAKKGVIHRNAASRQKARIAALLKTK